MKCQGCGKEISYQGYCQECKEKLVPFYVNKIKSLIKAYDYKNALFQCGQALNIDPTSAELLELEGEINRKLSEYQLYFSLGEENYNKGDYQKALEFYEKAYDINPLSSDLKMKLDMAKISCRASNVASPQAKEEETTETDEEEEHKWKIPTNTILYILALLVVTFSFFHYFRASYLRMNAARELFSRISAKIDEPQYLKGQFLKDYEVLEKRYRRTFYASQAELLYGDIYEREKNSRRSLAQIKKSLEDIPKNTKKLKKKKIVASSPSAPISSQKEETAKVKQEKALEAKAQSYFKKGFYNKALAAFGQALALAQKEDKKRIKSSMEKISRIIKQKNSRYSILVAEAYRLEKEGDFRRSLNYYYEALALRPHSKYCLLRINYIKRHFLSSFFKEYLSRQAFFWKGFWQHKDKILYLYNTAIKKAEERRQFKKAAELYNKLAFLKRIKSFRRWATWELELSLVERKLKKGKFSLPLLIEKAVVYYKMKDLFSAEKVLRGIILMGASSKYSLLARGLEAELLEAKGDYFQAEKILKKALEEAPIFVLKAKLGEFLYRQGRIKEALSYLQTIPARRLSLDDFIILGNIYLKMGKKSEAARLLEPLGNKSFSELIFLYRPCPFSFEFFQPRSYAQIKESFYQLSSLLLRVGKKAAALKIQALAY